MLPGEVYTGSTFSGYQERDYGASALYVRKSVNIDASGLPQWYHGALDRRRFAQGTCVRRVWQPHHAQGYGHRRTLRSGLTCQR